MLLTQLLFQIEDDEDLAERYKQKKMMEVEKNVTLMSIINQVGPSVLNFFRKKMAIIRRFGYLSHQLASKA